jgi:hypothetical protein
LRDDIDLSLRLKFKIKKLFEHYFIFSNIKIKNSCPCVYRISSVTTLNSVLNDRIGAGKTLQKSNSRRPKFPTRTLIKMPPKQQKNEAGNSPIIYPLRASQINAPIRI